MRAPVMTKRKAWHGILRLAALVAAGVALPGAATWAGEIVFVRHGETVANATGRYSSQNVNQLTGRGRAQGAALARLLERESFDVIVVNRLQVDRRGRAALIVHNQQKTNP